MTGIIIFSSSVPDPRGPADRRVVSDHLRAHHQHAFGDHRVHLARHDARPRLHLGQLQLAQAAARSGSQPANVIGDFCERDRVGLERAAQEHGGVARGLRLEVVPGLAERQPGLLARDRRWRRRRIREQRSGPCRPRCRPEAARRDPPALSRILACATFHLAGISAEFLPQAHGHGVLQVRPPDLENVPELLPLVFSAWRSTSIAGSSDSCAVRAAAMCSAVGNTSLLDWLRLT